METFFLRLLTYFTIAVALAEHSLPNGYQGGYLYHQTRSLRAVDAFPRRQTNGLERRETMKKPGLTGPNKLVPAPMTSKKATSSSTRGFSSPIPFQGSPPGARPVDRASSKRKDPDPVTGPSTQRQRISGSFDDKSSTSPTSSTKPARKPPLHPSFKDSPEYKVKMQRAAASKEASLRHKTYNSLPDTKFLSDFAEHSIDDKKYPEPKPWVPHQPPPFRSQVRPDLGKFIPVS